MRFFLVFGFLLVSTSLFSQSKIKEYNHRTNAQLINELKEGRRIARNELFQLFDYYNDNKNDSLYKIAHRIIEIGIQQENWFFINFGKAFVVTFYNNNDRIEMSTQMAQEALNYFLNQNDHEMISYLQNQIGISLVLAKKYSEARDWFKKSVESGKLTGSFEDNCVGLKNIAETYYRENNTTKAIEYANQFMQVINASSNEVAKMKAYNTIGNIYRDMNETAKAKSYYEKVLSFPQLKKSAVTEGNALNNLAMMYFEESPEKSKTYFFKSLEVRKKAQRPLFIADSYLNIGHWYFMMEQTDSAAYYYNTMLDFSKKNRHVEGELEALEALQNLYDELGDGEMVEMYKKQYTQLAAEVKQVKSDAIQEFIDQTCQLIHVEEDLVRKIKKEKNAYLDTQDLSLQRKYILGVIAFMCLLGCFLYVRKKSKKDSSKNS